MATATLAVEEVPELKMDALESPKLLANSTASAALGPLSIVLFGASGDLAKKKTFPALFNLFQQVSFVNIRLPYDAVVVNIACGCRQQESDHLMRLFSSVGVRMRVCVNVLRALHDSLRRA